MSGPLSFKAQALDNTSADFYQSGDDLLPAEDQARRRQITNAISEMAREGTPDLKVDGAELIFRGRCFLIQVYSEQIDHAGRRAPILCCGDFSHGDDPDAIIQALRGFAAKVGRTVDPGHIKTIRDGLARQKKIKHSDDRDAPIQARRDELASLKRSRAHPRAVGIGLAVLLAALLLFVLAPKMVMRPQTHSTLAPSIPTPER